MYVVYNTCKYMRIILFCEQKYAVSILRPIDLQARKEGNNEVLWYVHQKNIPEFPLDGEVRWTTDMQTVYDFAPEAVFVPCNIVPYYLPGVKIYTFHGYATEKKRGWRIRGYFDMYCTPGPYFTARFREMAREYGNFEVAETGWPRQDWIFHHLHDFDEEKARLLARYGKKRLVLYAPTFSPSLTSLPCLKDELIRLAWEKDILLFLKFHPLTKAEWIDLYKPLAERYDNIVWRDDHDISKCLLMADVMISDTSSAVYEFLLLDKPVITLNSIAEKVYWDNITTPSLLFDAFDDALKDKHAAERKWFRENYDPYQDGLVGKRMLDSARDYIARHGVPSRRRMNLWRQYTCVKRFGKVSHRGR